MKNPLEGACGISREHTTAQQGQTYTELVARDITIAFRTDRKADVAHLFHCKRGVVVSARGRSSPFRGETFQKKSRVDARLKRRLLNVFGITTRFSLHCQGGKGWINVAQY